MATSKLKIGLFLLLFLSASSSFGANIASSKPGGETKDIVILKNVKSLNEIFKRFRGRLIYIDIWATFCQPCIEDFQHKETMASFFNENRIVSLFISMDGIKQKQNWNEIIRKHRLKGYHLSMGTNGEMGKDILGLFTKSDGSMEMTVPRYLIVDRQGNVVVRDAFSPRQDQQLREQLSLYLK